MNTGLLLGCAFPLYSADYGVLISALQLAQDPSPMMFVVEGDRVLKKKKVRRVGA